MDRVQHVEIPKDRCTCVAASVCVSARSRTDLRAGSQGQATGGSLHAPVPMSRSCCPSNARGALSAGAGKWRAAMTLQAAKTVAVAPRARAVPVCIVSSSWRVLRIYCFNCGKKWLNDGRGVGRATGSGHVAVQRLQDVLVWQPV